MGEGPKSYRMKPVVVQALRWDGTNIEEVLSFLSPIDDLPSNGYVKPGVGHTPSLGTLDIPTLEGTMTANPGDWIIRGVKGEPYPCKNEIFEATYELDKPRRWRGVGLKGRQ